MMNWRGRSRDALAWAMDRLPDQWFVRLRALAADRSTGGRLGAGLTSVVGVARHRRIPEATFQLGGREDVTLSAADSWMTRVLYWHGAAAYEGAEAEYWQRACRRATKVLELGANIGYYSVVGAMANPECEYLAFEPHPVTATVARRNLELNAVANVRVVEAAVVGRPGHGSVDLSTPGGDRHGLPAQAVVRDGAEGVLDPVDRETNTVQAVFIGDVIEGADLLKLDIEGQEAVVLEAVFDQLVEQTPTIFVEVRLADVPHLRRVILDLVDGGYLAFAIGARSLHLLSRDELAADAPLPRYGSRDLLLTSARDAHLL